MDHREFWSKCCWITFTEIRHSNNNRNNHFWGEREREKHQNRLVYFGDWNGLLSLFCFLPISQLHLLWRPKPAPSLLLGFFNQPRMDIFPQIFGMKLRLNLQKLRQNREQIQTTSFKTHLLFIQFSFPHGTSLLFCGSLFLNWEVWVNFIQNWVDFSASYVLGSAPHPGWFASFWWLESWGLLGCPVGS